jgi:hypothetical protein
LQCKKGKQYNEFNEKGGEKKKKNLKNSGNFRVTNIIMKVTGSPGNFVVHTNKGEVHADYVVFAVPPPIAAKMNPDLGIPPSSLFSPPLSSFLCQILIFYLKAHKLDPYFARPDNHFGGGIVVFLGVPESEVEGQELLHHQLLQDYSKPQGTFFNFFYFLLF